MNVSTMARMRIPEPVAKASQAKSSARSWFERNNTRPSLAARTVTNIYHVHGHNARWNVNGTDQSVNIVNASSDQIFTDLRQVIESRVPEGDERKDILEKLNDLEKAQGSKSFGQRYTEFISVAANHMVLLAPFIPALSELLSRTLT